MQRGLQAFASAFMSKPVEHDTKPGTGQRCKGRCAPVVPGVLSSFNGMGRPTAITPLGLDGGQHGLLPPEERQLDHLHHFNRTRALRRPDYKCRGSRYWLGRSAGFSNEASRYDSSSRDRTELLRDLFVKRSFLPILLLATSTACEDGVRTGQWRAGCARVSITPERPVVLLGYGDRTGVFDSVAQEIYAKAMALEDKEGHRAVIVTADLVGFQSAVVTDTVSERIMQETGLERSQLLFNASHNHTGPLVSLDPWLDANVVAHAPLSPRDRKETVAYTRALQDKLVVLVRDALARLEPTQLSWGQGEVPFPMNRRLPRNGHITMADNPEGTVDRSVPVLCARTPEGEYQAVVFGTACHNTTLTGADNVIAGDFAGFAQSHLEERFHGAQAMFVSGCGADANPSPRGSMALARRHGDTLGSEVARVADESQTVVRGNLGTVYEMVELPLQPLSRAELQERVELPSAEAVMARHMLRLLEAGETLPRNYSAPVAVWRFGEAFTLVALPAEPVAEYVHLIKAALPERHLWIAGYNNDCFGYLPSAQVVNEGGHENIGVTLWIWGQGLRRNAGFFAPSVEDAIVRSVVRLAGR